MSRPHAGTDLTFLDNFLFADNPGVGPSNDRKGEKYERLDQSPVSDQASARAFAGAYASFVAVSISRVRLSGCAVPIFFDSEELVI